MKSLILVGLGGAAGSVVRYKIAAWVAQQAAGASFPYGTFAVNVLGCLAAGLLIGVAEHHALLTAQTRLLLFTGFLGGFTTFSAFGIETVALLQRGQLGIAATYVGASVACGLLVLWAGIKLGGVSG